MCRWVIGPTHPRGLEILRLSISQMHKLYPEFDLMLCFNQIQDRIVQDFKIKLYRQTGCELVLEPVLEDIKHGVSWKLYPPRLRKRSHEIIIDNDLVLFERVPEIDIFLRSQRALVLQAYHRNYGQFDKFVGDNFKINTGLFGLPPNYDFESCVQQLLKNRIWVHRGDEQGIVATCLQKLSPLMISYDSIVPLDDNAIFCRRNGAHFIHANVAKSHKAWDSYMRLGLFVIVGEGRDDQFKTQTEYLDRITPGIEKVLITDGDINIQSNYHTKMLHRHQKLFSFPDAIAEGYQTVKTDVVVYLDCDRIPDGRFFDLARTIKHGQLMACKKLYYVDTITSPPDDWEADFRISDVSVQTPTNKKNVMSGCVAMCKSTFQDLDIDRTFIGCGFADYDLAMSAQDKRFEIILLDLIERHLRHPISAPERQFKILNAWGGVRFYDKWKMPVSTPVLRLLKQLDVTVDEFRRYNLEYLIDKLC